MGQLQLASFCLQEADDQQAEGWLPNRDGCVEETVAWQGWVHLAGTGGGQSTASQQHHLEPGVRQPVCSTLKTVKRITEICLFQTPGLFSSPDLLLTAAPCMTYPAHSLQPVPASPVPLYSPQQCWWLVVCLDCSFGCCCSSSFLLQLLLSAVLTPK